MHVHRRALIGGLSAAAMAGIAGPAWAGARAGAAPGDDALGLPIIVRPELPAADGLLALYASNRARGVANLITESFLVQGMSLTRRRAQQRIEAQLLAPALAAWVAALRATAAATPDLPELARDTIAVLAALQGDRSAVAGRAQAVAECDQVIAAGAIAPSLLTGVALDFTQFKPRGDYAGDPAREAYFRTFRYAGTLAFLLVPSAATGVTDAGAARMAAAAVALSRLTEADAVRAVARPLFTALEAAFGPADDFGPFDAPAGLGPAAVREAWIADAEARDRLPQVIDVIYEESRLQGRSPAEVALSWRLLPGRRLADVAALQTLVYPATTHWSAPDPAPFDAGVIGGRLVKAYVGLDDVMALAAAGDSPAAFAGLAEAQQRARRAVLGATDVSAPMLRLLRMGLASGTPSLLRAHALATAYIQHRHAALLVAKQSYTAADKSIGLVRPRPDARLASTPHFTRGLAVFAAGMARHFPDPAWDRWSMLLGQLEDIAWLQQRWSGGSAQADRVLNDLDLAVTELVDPAQDRPIVVDIHSCPAESKVAEIGLGRPLVVQSGDAVGGVLPACQFKQPIGARLTDAAWAEQLGRERAAASGGGWPSACWTPRVRALR